MIAMIILIVTMLPLIILYEWYGVIKLLSFQKNRLLGLLLVATLLLISHKTPRPFWLKSFHSTGWNSTCTWTIYIYIQLGCLWFLHPVHIRFRAPKPSESWRWMLMAGACCKSGATATEWAVWQLQHWGLGHLLCLFLSSSVTAQPKLVLFEVLRSAKGRTWKNIGSLFQWNLELGLIMSVGALLSNLMPSCSFRTCKTLAEKCYPQHTQKIRRHLYCRLYCPHTKGNWEPLAALIGDAI